MKKKLLLFLFVFVGLYINAQTQTFINQDFVIVLENDNNKIPEYFEVNIQNLQFDSQEDLDVFCKMFSFDYHLLIGNLDSNIIRVKLNTAALNLKAFTLSDVNKQFQLMSKRMQLAYSNL